MDREPDLPGQLVQALLRGYQLTFSAALGRQCRFMPTCSAYAMEAVARHGVRRGGWLALGRVCRCGPRLPVARDWQERVLGQSHGWDPVPPADPADNR